LFTFINGVSIGIVLGVVMWLIGERLGKAIVGTPSTSHNRQSTPLSKEKPVPREGRTLNEGLRPNKQSTPLQSCVNCGSETCGMRAGFCTNWFPK